jgi:hypothetical protein
MRRLGIYIYLTLISGVCFATTNECEKISTNNPSLKIINIFLEHAKDSAEVIIEHLKDDKANKEFIGFHFGSINTTMYMLGETLVRAQLDPRRVLPEDEIIFSKFFNSMNNSHSWIKAIGCYRGVFSYDCIVEKDNKDMLISSLKDLVKVATDINESNSVKFCLLRGKLPTTELSDAPNKLNELQAAIKSLPPSQDLDTKINDDHTSKINAIDYKQDTKSETSLSK